jgi:hypothetical protein
MKTLQLRKAAGTKGYLEATCQIRICYQIDLCSLKSLGPKTLMGLLAPQLRKVVRRNHRIN